MLLRIQPELSIHTNTDTPAHIIHHENSLSRIVNKLW